MEKEELDALVAELDKVYMFEVYFDKPYNNKLAHFFVSPAKWENERFWITKFENKSALDIVLERYQAIGINGRLCRDKRFAVYNTLQTLANICAFSNNLFENLYITSPPLFEQEVNKLSLIEALITYYPNLEL